MPVRSLDPAGTSRLWRALVARRRLARMAADCRPLEAVFWSPTDWLRLATRLAAAASPCTEYFVSVAPLAASKTTLRRGEATRIRALGPGFHALAEIHYAGWASWVAANGGDWFAAGVEARRRMAAAGFDVAAGDSWALNEISSAVRRGTGTARQTVRDFLRGLATGDGGPLVRGVVFTVGLDQPTSSLAEYQARLQDWLEDAAFWTDAAQYVRTWAQEAYGDVRNYAVPGAPLAARSAYLQDYLEHALRLARAAPETAAAARSFLEVTYTPLAGAAWQQGPGSGYGWTQIPFDMMQQFVSAQVYALRSASGGRVPDRIGFAWVPRNGSGLSGADFVAQTNGLLDRLAAAIRDSTQASVDGADPALAACGPAGQNQWCGGDLEGAAFTETWKSFATWRPSLLAFATAPQALQPAVASAPLAVELRTAAGTPLTAAQPLPVLLASSSPTGTFAASAGGPWSSTLTVTIPAGSASTSFYFQDAQPGSPTISAATPGKLGATQTETVAVPAGTPATPPETAITSAPSGTVGSASATVEFASASAGARFECALDGRRFAPCSSPATYAGLASGRHVLLVRAIDAAGTVDPVPASASWTVDTTPPDTRVTKAPAPLAASRSATVWVAATERRAVLECSLDGAGFAPCRSPVRYRGLRDGRHRVQVRALDVVGNVDPTPAIVLWTVDATPPRLRIADGPASRSRSRRATFWIAASERRVRLQCSLDGRPYLSCSSPKRYSRLPPGRHAFAVRAIDAAGNRSRVPVLRRWLVGR